MVPLIPVIFALEKQYEGAAARMNAAVKLVKEQDTSELANSYFKIDFRLVNFVHFVPEFVIVASSKII